MRPARILSALAVLLLTPALVPSAHAGLPGGPPCGEFDPNHIPISRSGSILPGRMEWNGYDQMRGRIFQWSVASQGTGDLGTTGGYLEWGIYNADTGTLYKWGWVRNYWVNAGFLDLNIPFKRLCFAILNASSPADTELYHFTLAVV